MRILTTIDTIWLNANAKLPASPNSNWNSLISYDVVPMRCSFILSATAQSDIMLFIVLDYFDFEPFVGITLSS